MNPSPDALYGRDAIVYLETGATRGAPTVTVEIQRLSCSVLERAGGRPAGARDAILTA